MTSFESHFDSLKRVLGDEALFDIWPDFEPQYDEHEYAWTTLRGLNEVLILNCGTCDGPSDLRHVHCRNCMEKRGETAKKAYEKATGRLKERWTTVFLCRIHKE